LAGVYFGRQRQNATTTFAHLAGQMKERNYRSHSQREMSSNDEGVIPGFPHLLISCKRAVKTSLTLAALCHAARRQLS